MATYAGKLNVGGTTIPIGSTLYGTCATAAGTAAKVVSLANFDTLLTGVTVHVKFTNTNTAANPTLNVNSTGAKAIRRYGSVSPGIEPYVSWQAGAVMSFTYDGTAWQMNDTNLYDIVRTDVTKDGGHFTCWQFPTGEMIQGFSKNYRVAITSAWGAAYYSPSIVMPNWHIPFIGTPYIASATTAADAQNTLLGGITGTSSTAIGKTYLFRFQPIGAGGAADYNINIIGIGRWK